MRSKSWPVSRRRFSPPERVRLLVAYHRSQLTQREFVVQHGLSLATLTKWLRDEREGATAPGRESVPFAEVPLTQVLGTARWAAEIVRPDGWTVRLTHDAPAAWVDQLLRAC
jgi:transposase-like protein